MTKNNQQTHELFDFEIYQKIRKDSRLRGNEKKLVYL